MKSIRSVKVALVLWKELNNNLKTTPACKMRAGRGRCYWPWLECFCCWGNWSNLDLEVNPASAETGAYASELTWDQCPAGWLQSRRLYADRCQPPCAANAESFSLELGLVTLSLLEMVGSLQTSRLSVETLGLSRETDVHASAQVPDLIICKIFILIVEIILSLSKDLVEIMLNSTLGIQTCGFVSAEDWID